MNPTVIRIAHSRQRSGFTAFAFEFTPTERYGIQRSRVAIAMADTLQEAQDSALRRALLLRRVRQFQGWPDRPARHSNWARRASDFTPWLFN